MGNMEVSAPQDDFITPVSEGSIPRQLKTHEKKSKRSKILLAALEKRRQVLDTIEDPSAVPTEEKEDKKEEEEQKEGYSRFGVKIPDDVSDEDEDSDSDTEHVRGCWGTG